MRRLKRILKTKQGFTLVEEIIASAITVILLTAIVALLASCIRIYGNVKSVAQGRDVGEILLDKLAGEISGAQSGVAVTIGPDGSIIAFSDRTGSPVYITTREDGGVRSVEIHYRPVRVNAKTVYSAVDWTFDSAMYMGFSVSALRFEPVAGKNLVRIRVTLQRGGYTCEAERYAECYNLSADRIVTGTVSTEDG